MLKLKAGELDAIIGIPFNQAEGLKSDANIQVGVAPVFRIDLVQLNTTKKPFDDGACARRSTTPSIRRRSCKGILRGNGSSRRTLRCRSWPITTPS